VDLGDRRGCERGPVKTCKHVLHVRAQVEVKHRLDLGPRNLGRIVLQAAQLLDELGRHKVSPCREYLSELDERNVPVLERDAQ